MKRSILPLSISCLVAAFFYIPIVLLTTQSFNSARYGNEWKGFTWEWYQMLFKSDLIWSALRNSLTIATISTIAACVLGTFSAWAMFRYKNKLQGFHHRLVYAPLLAPDLLMGISLLLFFVELKIHLGLTTIIIAHITFCLSYVATIVYHRLEELDLSILDAARDLGADRWQTFWHVLLPFLLPGIFASALFAFTLSIDDFVVTFFVAGPGNTTLPLYIYSSIKHGNPTIINALCVIMMSITFVCILIGQITIRGTKSSS
jgi:spermidine/putrescine transport system permease protein